MDQDRWKTVNVIFHAALEVSSSERHSFVLTASEGDPDLQAEVELLLKADQDAGSYLESPLVPAELFSNSVSPVNPGDVLCGRFRILRAVGEGGMGHVFEALDSELAVHVALKIIRPEIAANPEALVRFRQEVRLARRITHPNVCRTFDIERETRVVDATRGTKQEVVFLTMEFLEGETLASRIKRDGPLPLNEALHVARQTADALQASNTLGIVHRDMKPANIMLVPSEATAPIGFRAVITDFGLARLDPVVSPSNLSAFSNTARPIGTLAYMAPEQLENAHISSATDIYAFGLVLFEMVTGTRAFPSDNLLSGIAQRLTGSPPLPQSLVPDLPIHWCRTIEGCLRLKPTDRFQFASDVMEVLDGKHIGLLRIVRPSLGQRLSLATGPIRRRVLSLAAICLVMVALFLGGLRIYRTVTDLKVAPGALVYLAPVSNQTGEKSLDNVTELIGAGLSQSVQVNLLDQGRVGDILQRMTKAPDTLIDPPIAREIAMRAGAVRVIFATVTGSAGSYSLNIDIQQPDASDLLRFRDHWPKSFLWHTSSGNQSTGTIPAELLSTIRTTSDWIRHEVGESANDIARLDAPPEDVTTGNWQALGEYKLSRELSEKDRPQEEVIALERAVEIDPGFALAWGRLGDLLMTLHRETEGYDAYDRATSQELLNRLSSREKYRILGMQAEDQWRWQDAERYFENWQTLYPNDYLAFVYPSWSLRKLGKADLDVENLRRAVELAPGQTYIKDSLAEALMIDGHHQEGREIVAELLRNGNSVDRARLTEARIDFLDFRFDDAARDLQALTHSSDRRALSDSFLWLASFFAEQGRFHEAWETLTEGMQADRKLGHPEAQSKKLIYRGWISAKLGRFAECAEDVHEGLKLDSSPSQILRAEDVLGGAITIAPTASTRELRTEMVEIGTRLPKDRPGPSGLILELRTRGEILLAQGHAAAAVAEFRKLDKIDSQVGSREYLGRSLLALAAKVSDSDVGTQLRREAMTAYSQMALRPNCLWGWAISYPPGFWADELTSYLKLANELGDDSSSASAALTNLHRLRGLIFPNAGQDSSHLNKRHNNANRSQRNSEEYHGSN